MNPSPSELIKDQPLPLVDGDTTVVLVVVAVLAGLFVGYLIVDYIVTRRREIRFGLRKKK